MEESFEWDPQKDLLNQLKHRISFSDAQRAFADPKRVIRVDHEHSAGEPRFLCLGRVDGKVLTVRFTLRQDKVRIFGAGCWRKGGRQYEKEIHLPKNT